MVVAVILVISAATAAAEMVLYSTNAQQSRDDTLVTPFLSHVLVSDNLVQSVMS